MPPVYKTTLPAPPRAPRRPQTETRLLSVIVPVYNEADTLPDALRAFLDVELPTGLEIICVDDGSTDASLKLLRGVQDPRLRVIAGGSNRGKGAALRLGFAEAKGDYVLVQDADLEYDPRDWPGLLAPVLRGDTRVVYGSRFLGDCRGMKAHSYLANRFLTLLTKVLFGSGLTDMETCYKLIDADLLAELPLTADRFDFEPQITALLLQRGERIVEVPISYDGRDRAQGKKIGFRDGIDAVRMLIRCRRERR